ncbi:ribonuclease H1-like [Ptychodera flava]|uniref:ribonuclease H1-like n=1 Tax=Ptychodera flava TaxID=63121 RepID=UPI00396A465E
MIQSLSRRLLLCTMGRWFYAVRVGRKPGIYATWDDCQKQVTGFSGARFKKFPTQNEAEAFIGNATQTGENHQQTNQPDSVTGRIAKSTVSFTTKGSSSTQCSSVSEHPNQSSHGPNQSRTGKRSFSTDSNSNRQKKRPKIDLNKVDRVVVYTDGACSSNGRNGARAGLGVYWGPEHPKNISERIDGRQTNQRAEMLAAVRALETAKEMNIKSLAIYTDSMFTINCITQWIHNWKRNGWKTKTGPVIHKEELIQLDKLCNELDVSWVHIPGHKNIHGNEEADRLARAGALKPLN